MISNVELRDQLDDKIFASWNGMFLTLFSAFLDNKNVEGIASCQKTSLFDEEYNKSLILLFFSSYDYFF